jgi:hypothetical protein
LTFLKTETSAPDSKTGETTTKNEAEPSTLKQYPFNLEINNPHTLLPKNEDVLITATTSLTFGYISTLGHQTLANALKLSLKTNQIKPTNELTQTQDKKKTSSFPRSTLQKGNEKRDADIMPSIDETEEYQIDNEEQEDLRRIFFEQDPKTLTHATINATQTYNTIPLQTNPLNQKAQHRNENPHNFISSPTQQTLMQANPYTYYIQENKHTELAKKWALRQEQIIEWLQAYQNAFHGNLMAISFADCHRNPRNAKCILDSFFHAYNDPFLSKPLATINVKETFMTRNIHLEALVENATLLFGYFKPRIKKNPFACACLRQHIINFNIAEFNNDFSALLAQCIPPSSSGNNKPRKRKRNQVNDT